MKESPELWNNFYMFLKNTICEGVWELRPLSVGLYASKLIRDIGRKRVKVYFMTFFICFNVSVASIFLFIDQILEIYFTNITGVIRVVEPVGSELLLTPLLILTSPPRGYAKADGVSIEVKYIMGDLKWLSKQIVVGWGTWAQDGEVVMICQLAEWTMYHVYDKDVRTGKIVADYGYHAKVTNWEPLGHRYTDVISLFTLSIKDYRNISETSFKRKIHNGYEIIFVDISYSLPENESDRIFKTDMEPLWLIAEGKDGLFLSVSVKVEIAGKVSFGELKVHFLDSRDHILYYFPPGHVWRVQFLGPIGFKIVFDPWPKVETTYPLFSFILEE